MNPNLPSVINFDDPKVIEVIKNTVAKGTTNHELAMFLEICRSSGLNPFQKMIWCIITGSGEWRKVQMMTSNDGYFYIANKHSEYDGNECTEGPEIVIEERGQKIIACEWIEIRAYRRDRSRPQSYKAYWKEFAQDLFSKSGKLTNWGSMPKVMLRKCAESHALKRTFPQETAGLLTQEEMPEDFHVVNAEQVETPPTVTVQEEVKFTETSNGINNGIIRHRYFVEPFLKEDPENIDKIEALVTSLAPRFYISFNEDRGEVESACQIPKLARFEIKPDLNMGGTHEVVDMEEAL